MPIINFFIKLYNVLIYGGLSKQLFKDVLPDVFAGNRRSCIYANALSTIAFASLTILAKTGISSTYTGNLKIYTIATIVFASMLFLAVVIGRKWNHLLNALCYFYVVAMLHVGVFMAIGPGKNYITLSFIVFMVAVPLFFTLRPIYICITIVVTQIYFTFKIASVQSGELYRINIINTWVYCVVSLLVVVIMMKIKYERFGGNYQYRVLLITDSMTGLYNRRSYEQKLTELDESLKDFVAIVFDINGLKHANDTIGHNCGDELICGTASIINEVFSEKNMYNYRVGGDEFVTIIEGQKMDIIEEKYIAELKKKTEDWRGNLVDRLYISYGMATNAGNGKSSFVEVIKVAESIMYENKTKFYQETGFERRKR